VRRAQRIPTRTPESRAIVERVRLVMELTSQLNALPFEDLEGRRSSVESLSATAS
jgi:hypothetical protein